MNTIVIKNGLIGGMIVSAVMAGMTLYMKSNTENEPSVIIGIFSMIIAFSFLVFGIIQQRKIDNGIISFGKAFMTGLKITLIIATIYVLVWLIIYYNFFPNFIEQYTEMVLKKTSPEDLVAKTAEMDQMKEWYKSPILVILLTYGEILPLGLIISLLSSLILKNNKKNSIKN